VKEKISLPGTLIIISLILGGFYYMTEINKQKLIQKSYPQVEKTEEKIVESEKTSNIIPNIKAENNSEFLPEEYSISVLHNGGIGSRTLTKTAMYDNGYLKPAEDYVLTYINKSGDHMWIWCKEGYDLDNGTIVSGNQYVIDPILGIGLLLENKLQNSARAVCKRSNT